MILVDTAVWIDHLHATEPRLQRLLEQDEVGCHPTVIQELALGSIKDRGAVLGLLSALRPFPVLTHDEVMTLVSRRRLWRRGLSPGGAHLLGAVSLQPAGRLWTRDKRLLSAARESRVPCLPEE